MFKKTTYKFSLLSLTLVLLLLTGISQIAFAAGGDGDIARRFVVDDIHASEYCTENAITMREFAPNTIMTGGVIDPFFAKGGTQFFPTDRPSGKAKIYVIAVDFTDLKGEIGVPYGLQRNVFRNQGSIYDLSDPQIIYESTFFGSNGFNGSAGYQHFGANGVKNMDPAKFVWGTTDVAQDFKGLVQIVNEVSLGTFEIEVECLNERLAQVQGLDPVTAKWPWFHLDGPMIGYAVQGPADCEDYRQFSRLHQAAIDAAYRDIPGLDLEDIDLIYTVVPISSFGHRAGLQGGGGLDTSFSFNDQALLQRESEFRHKPGITTKEGRIVGSGVFGIKNLWSAGNPRSAVNTSMHEFLHGMGMFDDYSYGSMGTNPGEVTTGSKFGGDTADLTSWKKYRCGWIPDDEIKVVLPGDTETIRIRATASYGEDGGSYIDDPGITTRMVLIPKEWRTRDTFGVIWNNGWNPKKLDYNWYDWFTNPFIGGETYAIKSFPTFLVVESRKRIGADNAMSAANQGVVVSMIANPTWETGHGAGGFKLCSTSTGMKTGATFIEPCLGLTITVLENGDFYDTIKVDYTGKATPTVNTANPGPAKHIYQAELTASENYLQANDAFTVDFDILTLGANAINDTPNPTTTSGNAVMRVATPLGVPGGLAGFKMAVEFDAANFDYVSTGSAPFSYEVDTSNADLGRLVITAAGTEMIDKDTILSLGFKAKAGATAGDYLIKGTISDVTLLNWRGETVKVGGPGFDGVGQFGSGANKGTLAALYNTVADNTYTPDIISTGGMIHLGSAKVYTVSGQITCDTPAAEAGKYVGVESEVILYDKDGKAVAKTKSDWDGYYSIDGVPAGVDYYITADKPKYFLGEGSAFNISDSNAANIDLQLARLSFKVSGTILAGVNSNGSDAVPLAGAEVYVLNIGNAYKVLGGPVLTDAEGKYTLDATVETWNKPFAAVAVKTPEGYKPQMHIADEHLGALELNLGRLYGIDPSDRVYPSNTLQYGVGGGYNFLLDRDITGRNITLTKNQEVHIRIATKSTAVYYQLKRLDGAPVGAPLQSIGNANGDDVLQNVEPGMYYIEASRSGYMSACTMPFGVDTTRVFLRNAFSTNTFDLVTTPTAAANGTVYDIDTKEILPGVQVQLAPFNNARGGNVPVLSDGDGKFSTPDIGGDRSIIFSKAGYVTKTINFPSGTATDLVVELEKIGWNNYKPVLRVAKAGVAPGGSVDVTYSIIGNVFGFTNFDLELPYDSSIYKPILITPAASLGVGGSSGIFAANPVFDGKDILKIAYASSDKVMDDVLVFTVKYEVVAMPSVLEAPLTVNVIKAGLNRYLEEFFDVDLQVEEGILVIGIMGDIDGNGKVTPEDAILLLQMYVGLVPWTNRALVFGDINGDGVIDSTDAALILRMVVG
ncbi:MAG: dockerin type I domain-containing protein, partial [Clostridiales bacterium]|nr:dockerin type I domain-containing protein [Clostridiales bacterium]